MEMITCNTKYDYLRRMFDLKQVVKTLLTIALYELVKYTVDQIIIKQQSNDDIDLSEDHHEDSWKYQY